MTQEDKELLLKDLCARLPYNVKINVGNDTLFIPRLKYIDGLTCHFWECSWTKFIDEIKPYLRPKTKMTKEEKETYHKLCHCVSECIPDIEEIWRYDYYDTVQSISFLQEIHIDIWNLIPKGLAFEAPEGMYNT